VSAGSARGAAAPPTLAPNAVWINGERQDANGVHISARDRGFTLADGVFETMRVLNGRVFRLERHLARLTQALMTLRIPVPPDVRDWVLTAVREAAPSEASVRLTVTRGRGGGGLAPSQEVHPTVVVSVGAMPAFPASTYERGLTAHVVPGRRNEYAMTAGLKTLAYTDAIAGLQEAQRVGADEALFLDTKDHCSEASASNVFLWTGRELLTPPVSCGALPGITRATLMELAYVAGLEVSDRAFGLDELLAGEESFLTSSLRGIAPLVQVNGQPIGAGEAGAMVRRLADAYAEAVHRECEA
jgi:branched-chain amino acid aminotransferase